MGEELEISGKFIYNGLRYFHEMENLYYETEIFEVLYNLSVGLERLLKVAVILIEHDDVTNQESFEQTLITHNHLELLRRIHKKYSLSLASPHKELLQILGTFYKTHRYGRYGTEAMKTTGEEKVALHKYIEKYLKIKISDENFFVTQNDKRIKKFLGRIVGKITSEIFKIVREESHRLNLYTYELKYNSKASKIFLSKTYDFINEDRLLKELLIYLINSNDTTGHLRFIKEIEPLEFDPALVADYIKCFSSDEKKLEVMDEVEALYEDVEDPAARLEMLDVIGNSSVHFDFEDDDCW